MSVNTQRRGERRRRLNNESSTDDVALCTISMLAGGGESQSQLSTADLYKGKGKSLQVRLCVSDTSSAAA